MANPFLQQGFNFLTKDKDEQEEIKNIMNLSRSMTSPTTSQSTPAVLDRAKPEGVLRADIKEDDKKELFANLNKKLEVREKSYLEKTAEQVDRAIEAFPIKAPEKLNEIVIPREDDVMFFKPSSILPFLFSFRS